jgi:O-glycosyl hydrolase
MKICDEKSLDVAVNGKLRTVSVSKLLRLIVDGKTPALTRQAGDDLKRLMWLLTQIHIQGDWLLQSPWAVPSRMVTGNKTTPKR